MYNYSQVYTGLEEYINHEILEKIPGWKKWIVGTALEMAIANGNNIFNELKGNEVIKMLNIIDDKEHINVEGLYHSLKKQAEHEDITFDMPVIGTLTLTHEDVDKLYHYIRKEVFQ